MKNKGKSIRVLILVGIMIFISFSQTVIADSRFPIETFASDYIAETNVKVGNSANGEIEITGELKAKRTMARLGFEYIKVEKYENQRWNTVKTLEMNIYKYNSTSIKYFAIYKGELGVQYRVVMKFHARDETGSDARVLYSSSIIAQR